MEEIIHNYILENFGDEYTQDKEGVRHYVKDGYDMVIYNPIGMLMIKIGSQTIQRNLDPHEPNSEIPGCGCEPCRKAVGYKFE